MLKHLQNGPKSFKKNKHIDAEMLHVLEVGNDHFGDQTKPVDE